jgi:hypothetical protein
MQGRIRMLTLATTTALSLLCQGCAHKAVAVNVQTFAAPTPNAPISAGMQLASGQPATTQATRTVSASLTAFHHHAEAHPGAIPVPKLSGLSGEPANLMSDVSQSWQGERTQPQPRDVFVGLNALRMSRTAALETLSADLAASRLASDFAGERRLAGEMAFTADARATGLPLDLGFAPRAEIASEGNVRSSRIGAEVRFGEGLDERGESSSARSWYVFAGADGEALCWDVGDRGLSFDDSVRLRDQVTVGDIQAGVSFLAGGGQLSLSYIRREVEYSDRSEMRGQENEDFAGVSFSLRR